MNFTKPVPLDESKFPRFVAPGEEPMMIALTSGHATAVTNDLDSDGTPLHPRFQRVALSRGCLPIETARANRAAQITDEEPDPGTASAGTRQNQVIQTIETMMAEAADDDAKAASFFTVDGKPSVEVITRRLGFKVAASERDSAWAIISRDS